MMTNQHYLKAYDNVLQKEICQNLIEHFESSDKKEIIKNELMQFEQLNISETYDDSELIKIMLLLFEQYKSECGLLDIQVPDKFGCEQIRMKKYYNEECDFKPHVDVIDLNSSKRYLSFLFYLNDTDGGETVFINSYSGGLQVTPKQGTVVMFPPTWNYPHFAKPIQSSNKYILSSYINFL